MELNVIQINGGITTNVDMSVKKVTYVKKIIFGYLLRLVEKIENIKKVLQMIQRLRVIKF